MLKITDYTLLWFLCIHVQARWPHLCYTDLCTHVRRPVGRIIVIEDILYLNMSLSQLVIILFRQVL